MSKTNSIKRSLSNRLLIAAPLVIAGLGGCIQEQGPIQEQGTEKLTDKAAQSATSLDRVTAGPPVKKTLRLFTEQPGRVLAFEESPITSKLSGYVESVHFDIGDHVQKGQVLIRIHAPEYKDQVTQKRGLLGQAEAQVKQAEAGLVAAQAVANSAKALLALAEAGVGRSEAEFARWESENRRIQQLASKGSVTAKLADETTSQYQAAGAARQESLATIESARAKQQEAEANVLTARADVDVAKSKLVVAQADLGQAETMLHYTELIAPFDGVVSSRKVDAGHYVQPAGSPNASPLMTIASARRVRVFVQVPESEAAWIDAGFGKADQGDSVTITSGVPATTTVEARVTRTSQQLDPQSRSLFTEIDLDNSDNRLLPGAFVTAKILLEQRSDVLVLPITAIVKSDKSKTGSANVCCVVVDGKIEHKPIELGLRVGDEVEIKSGLEGKEAVVLARAGTLQPGQSVEIIRKP